MRASTFSILGLLLSLTAAPALAADPTAAEATVPLHEILRLYRETDEAKRKTEEAPPPVRATVHKLDLQGRLLDRAIDARIRCWAASAALSSSVTAMAPPNPALFSKRTALVRVAAELCLLKITPPRDVALFSEKVQPCPLMQRVAPG